MELISRAALLGLIVLAGVLLFTPYEAFLEGALALLILAIVLAGSFMHPKKEVFYVRTALPLTDPSGNQKMEHDFLAVRIELVRLWMLFVPTALATALLVFFAARPVKFSVLNWVLSTKYAFFGFYVCEFLPVLVLVLLAAWIGERRVMRDAEACVARSVAFPRLLSSGLVGRVSYQFMGEHGEYYGGDCVYFRFARPNELANIVFYNVRRPDLNKIAMGFLFHNLLVLGRGVTDWDKHTLAAQTALAEVRVPAVAPD